MNSDRPLRPAVEDKYDTFVNAYFTNGFKPGEAALEAGYESAATGNTIMKDPRLQAKLKARFDDLAASYSVNQQRIIHELACIAFLDPLDIFDENWNVRNLSDIPENARRAIGGFDVMEVYERQGRKREHIGEIKKIKLCSKEKALELLGKYLNMFSDKVTLTHEGSVDLRPKIDKGELDSRIRQIVTEELGDALQ